MSEVGLIPCLCFSLAVRGMCGWEAGNDSFVATLEVPLSELYRHSG